MKIVATFLAVVLLGIFALGGFVYSGLYPIGADVPHERWSYDILEVLRERSVQRASGSIKVPDLSDPELLLAGGSDYNAMCVGCHLKPGTSESDLSVGLYPSPPSLASDPAEEGHEHGDSEDAARRRFWVIKHGIKASGMPAWGKTHDDQRIWAMVAFLEKLPELTPIQYQILTADGERHDGH